MNVEGNVERKPNLENVLHEEEVGLGSRFYDKTVLPEQSLVT